MKLLLLLRHRTHIYIKPWLLVLFVHMIKKKLYKYPQKYAFLFILRTGYNMTQISMFLCYLYLKNAHF